MKNIFNKIIWVIIAVLELTAVIMVAAALRNCIDFLLAIDTVNIIKFSVIFILFVAVYGVANIIICHVRGNKHKRKEYGFMLMSALTVYVTLYIYLIITG